MLFLHYQVYYESPNPKIRGHKFNVLDYMEWYAKNKTKKKQHFSHPKDFIGFNIPTDIIDEIIKKGIDDENKYDAHMLAIYNKIPKSSYLIGTINGDKGTLKHEIAHGLYYTNEEYKKEMLKAVGKLSKKSRKCMEKILGGSGGYAKEVFDDEIQAYLSTEKGSMKSKATKKERNRFKKYSRDTKHDYHSSSS